MEKVDGQDESSFDQLGNKFGIDNLDDDNDNLDEIVVEESEDAASSYNQSRLDFL